jgi:glutathione-specific gamma-glutamylcyclotransferase
MFGPICPKPDLLTTNSEESTARAGRLGDGPKSRFYTRRLPAEEIARVLANACGHWGSEPSASATPSPTCKGGIYDRGLWKPKELAAERVRDQ